MKKVFSLIIILVVCTGVGAWVTAGAADKEEIFCYGDYTYTLANGLATIVGYRDPYWDDEDYPFDRPGMEDESARFPESCDADGVWRIVVPAMLDGHPVVAVGDYVFYEGVWGDVVLPESLTSIGAGAFKGSDYTDAITIPASVTFIGQDAFGACGAVRLRVTEGSYAAQYAEENGELYTYNMEYAVLKSGGWRYTLTDGTATIYAFNAYDYNDDDDGIVVDLVIPDYLDGYLVTAINYQDWPWSFERVNKLTAVTIPDSVTEIAGNPFAGCEFLSGIIVFPSNPVYEAVDGVLFDKQRNILVACPGARTGVYAIPEGVTAIGDKAFYGCKGLVSVTILPSVKSIGDWAFYGCKGLTSVIIPPHMKSIGDWAFTSCDSLLSVTIPASVTNIGVNPFRARSLEHIEVSSNNPTYEAVDGVLFDKQQKMLVSWPHARKGDYAIPEEVVSIGDHAFFMCEGLSGVTIPESVTHIGFEAFSLCGGLNGVTIPAGVTSISERAFSLAGRIIPLSVTEGSYAEQYAKENNFHYTYTSETTGE